MKRRNFIFSTAAALAATPLYARANRPRIRIGQIGLAHPHSLGKLNAIRSLPDTYDLVGVVEPDLSLRKRAKGLNFISLNQLMNTKGLEAVAIETRVKDLVTTALPVVEAGKHIHLDKPAGPALAPFQKLLDLAERQRLTVQMGYMLRYNPAFTFMFKAVREGWFGEIMEIDAMMGKKAGDGMRKELAEFRGGGFFELACHILDAAIHILGKPQAVHGFNLRTRKKSGDTFADNQLAVLKFAKATACLRCNHNDPFGFPRRRFNIAGSRGGMEIQQLESGRFVLNLDQARGEFKKGSQTVQLKGGRSYSAEFTDLARAIRGEKQLAWSYQHDLAVHETLLKICGMG
ncbi:MAG: Gfo/Idh/MocA family oxidoreductase [Verrucomicrobiota bacterium]|jgi:predicted dehydrogenase|nr:Gfo/Idh/MocA family oxidoreductase [Verrucomicrobiota bacterium]